MADQQDAQTRQSLIEYPCDFPIKVMGARVDGFAQAVIEVAGAGFNRVKSAGRAWASSALTACWLVASVLPL